MAATDASIDHFAPPLAGFCRSAPGSPTTPSATVGLGGGIEIKTTHQAWVQGQAQGSIGQTGVGADFGARVAFGRQLVLERVCGQRNTASMRRGSMRPVARLG